MFYYFVSTQNVFEAAVSHFCLCFWAPTKYFNIKGENTFHFYKEFPIIWFDLLFDED